MDVDHRRQVKRQHLGQQQAADHGEPERRARLAARAQPMAIVTKMNSLLFI